MDREWFETRRRTVNRLQTATLVMMGVFFVFYFMARTGTGYAAPIAWATFFVFAALAAKRQRMVSEYNDEILARDPMLLDEFIPLVR
jgi:hypothetical protein